MDIVDLGCLVLRAAWLDWLMKAFSFFGQPMVVGTVGAALWLHGHTQENPKTKPTGLALLIALAAVAGSAEGIKRLLQLTDIESSGWLASPSLQTACAFGLAWVTAASFPTLRSVLFLCAALAAIARLYFHGPPTGEILGGALLGSGVGFFVARYFITLREDRPLRALDLIVWAGTAVIALSALVFFSNLQSSVRAARIDPQLAKSAPALVTLDFGSPQARQLLRHGWSGDEWWAGSKQSVVWGTGLGAEMIVQAPAAHAINLRLHVAPYGAKGPSCQRIEIQINDSTIGKITLKHGWQWSQIAVPANVIKTGNNTLQFFFAYADSPQRRTGAPDERNLSVAFDRLELVPGS